MKKTIIIMLALLALCTPIFAGGQSENTAAKSTASIAPTLNADGSFHLPIVDSPKEFTIFLNFNNMPFDSNCTPRHNLPPATPPPPQPLPC